MVPGQVIGGRYECLTLIGRGGMGEVWRARDTLLGRDVAVKRLVYADGVPDSSSVARSLREARLAARLNHPNAVSIYDVVTDPAGLPCLVLELVEGESLKDLIAGNGSLPPSFVARIGRQVAAALARAHRSGIVHRDIKPANVLIASDGTAKLTDFGIARDEGDSGLTSTGTFIGTPSFLAPEVALGRDHVPASDVWALGAVLYTCVEGAAPFSVPNGNALAILNLIATSEAPVASHGGALTPIIGAMMRRDPAGRPDAAGVDEQLAALAGPRPTDPTPHPPAPHPPTPHPPTPHPPTPHPSPTPPPVTPRSMTPLPTPPHPMTPHPMTPHPMTPNPVTPNPMTPRPLPAPAADRSRRNWTLKFVAALLVLIALIVILVLVVAHSRDSAASQPARAGLDHVRKHLLTHT